MDDNASGYRALLSPGTGEADIDTCVPSTTLVAMMLRWMLVFEERDVDTVWLLKAAPRRFYLGSNDRRAAADDDENSFLVVRQAATRFGWVSFSVDKQTDDKGTVPVASIEGSSLHIEANVSLVLHGRGFVGTGDCLRVVVRLRDPAGERSLKSASITGSIGGRVTIAEVDSAGESVAVEVPRAVAAQAPAGGTSIVVSFSIVAQLQ